MTWVQLKNGLSVLQNPRSFDQHAQFQLTERGFLTQIYGPQLCLFDEKGSSQQLDAFSATVRLAYQNGIDLRILISPSHARLWEALDQAGLWPQWELWKRALVRIVDQSAQDKRPFPLWDFSGFHEFAREEVPQSPSGPIMRWYWESSHYKKELGDLVLDQVLGYDSAEASKRPDFGVLINSSNIELHLATIRAEHLKWRATSTDANEVDEAGASYRAVREANAQCPLPQSAPQSLY
jgi:hypothetical protein